MKPNDDEVKAIEVNAIFQVSPKFEHEAAGCLLIVDEVHTWGVVGSIVQPGTGPIVEQRRRQARVAWEWLEPTGGHAAFAYGGAPIARAAKLKHHP